MAGGKELRSRQKRLFSKASFLFLTLLLQLSPGAAAAYSGDYAEPPVECAVPEWLRSSMMRSMNAVWKELQSSTLSSNAARNTLALVASRLFPSFCVSLNSNEFITLKAEKNWRWKLFLQSPERAMRMSEPLSISSSSLFLPSYHFL